MPDMYFSAKGGTCPLLPSRTFRLCPLFEKVARGPGQQRHLPHLQESHGNGDKPSGNHGHQERPAQLQELRLHYKDPLGADRAAREGMRVSTSPLSWRQYVWKNPSLQLDLGPCCRVYLHHVATKEVASHHQRSQHLRMHKRQKRFHMEDNNHHPRAETAVLS